MEIRRTKNRIVGAIIAAVVIILVIIALVTCTVKVPAGYVGVQYNMNGGISKAVLHQGWHIVSPTTKVTLYSVSLEQSYLTKGDKGDSPDNERFSASTNEGKSISIDLTYTYQYNQNKVTDLFTRFRGQSGKEVRDSFIKPNIVSWTKEVIAKYSVTDILGDKRAQINEDLTQYLNGKFASYGIDVSNVSLINVSVDKTTQKAINEKINAQQAAEKQAIENQTNIDKAKADAEAKVTEAQGKADAKKIEADAEAEANNKISSSLNSDILRQQWIEKWDGQLPKVSGSDDSTVLVNPNTSEDN